MSDFEKLLVISYRQSLEIFVEYGENDDIVVLIGGKGSFKDWGFVDFELFCLKFFLGFIVGK